jgi:hypothetical protein
MDSERLVRLTNRNMIIFDAALGAGALLAPEATLKLIGHDAPSADATHLFRRCGPIWLTYAFAHLLAARRDGAGDWWGVAWLRGSEIATDVVWSQSPGLSRPGAKQGLWFAGVFNLLLSLGARSIARRKG